MKKIHIEIDLNSIYLNEKDIKPILLRGVEDLLITHIKSHIRSMDDLRSIDTTGGFKVRYKSEDVGDDLNYIENGTNLKFKEYEKFIPDGGPNIVEAIQLTTKNILDVASWIRTTFPYTVTIEGNSIVTDRFINSSIVIGDYVCLHKDKDKDILYFSNRDEFEKHFQLVEDDLQDLYAIQIEKYRDKSNDSISLGFEITKSNLQDVRAWIINNSSRYNPQIENNSIILDVSKPISRIAHIGYYILFKDGTDGLGKLISILPHDGFIGLFDKVDDNHIPKLEEKIPVPRAFKRNRDLMAEKNLIEKYQDIGKFGVGGLSAGIRYTENIKHYIKPHPQDENIFILKSLGSFKNDPLLNKDIELIKELLIRFSHLVDILKHNGEDEDHPIDTIIQRGVYDIPFVNEFLEGWKKDMFGTNENAQIINKLIDEFNEIQIKKIKATWDIQQMKSLQTSILTELITILNIIRNHPNYELSKKLKTGNFQTYEEYIEESIAAWSNEKGWGNEYS
jgi:hypothetical protein